MKHKLLLTTLFLFSVNCIYSQNEKNKTDLQNDNIKGKVEKIDFQEYDCIEKTGEVFLKNIILETQSRFNNFGNITQYYVLKDDSIVKKIIHNYSTKKEEYFSTDYNIDFKFKKVIVYDDNKNIIEEEYYPFENNKYVLSSKWTYIYIKGNLITSTLYSIKENKLLMEETNIYDDNNNLEKTLHKNFDNNTFHQDDTEISYKKDDKIVTVNYRRNDGSLNYQKVFKYKNSQLTDKSEVINNQIYTQEKYLYNENLDLIQIDFFNSKYNTITIHSYVYTYDTQKNWITKKQFINNKLEKIYFREIDYY